MSQFKQIVFVLLFCLFGNEIVAQNLSLVPVEGSIHTYSCGGISAGSNYVFQVVANNGGQPGDFEIIGSNSGIIGTDGIATTQIQWNTGSSLDNYKIWLEVEHQGCSNRIFLGISPQPNDRTIEFDITASNECFNFAGNNFIVSIVTYDNNRQPIPAACFPLFIEFTVNGNPQSQLLSFNDQQLQISETMFSAAPDVNTQIEVILKGVSDVNDAPVQPGVKDMYQHTIFAIPEIEFTEELRNKYYESESFIAYYSLVFNDDGRLGSR